MKPLSAHLQRILEELEHLLGSEVIQVLLRQLPVAEALYFFAQQEEGQKLIQRVMAELPRVATAGQSLKGLAKLASRMDKAQKSLSVTSKPDEIRAIAQQVTDLGLQLEARFDLLAAEARPLFEVLGDARTSEQRETGEVTAFELDIETFEREVSGVVGPPQVGATDAPRGAPKLTRTRTPRYANAALLNQTTGALLDPQSSLETGSVLRLRLDIGRLSPENQVSVLRPFPDPPRDIVIDVMVSSTDFGVARRAAALDGTDPIVAHGGFFLPRDGGPAVTRDGGRYLTFYLKAPERLGRAHCRIGYYYRNILVQSQHVIAYVGEPGGFNIQTDFTLSDDLTHLESIPTRPRISVLTNSNGQGGHQIVLRRPGVLPADGDPGETFEVNEENIGDTIRDLRKALALRAPTDKHRNRALLEEDLRQFAPLGWSLYAQVPGKFPYMFEQLYTKPDDFVVHVARPTTSSFVLPWGFVYEIPLLSGNRWALCPLITQWDGTNPLFQGSPRQCPHGPHMQDTLCPFGFWGFRYAIEQLSSSDQPVLTIPASPPCDFVVGETQYDVNLGELATHVSNLRNTIAKVLPQAQFHEGKDKAKIQTLLGRDLPFVYFYCHGERLNVADPNPWLAVGNRETITASDFIGWVVIWQHNLKKRIWNDVRPLVFINACHSLAIEPKTLVSYLDAFVTTGRAAGVIGTEIKVNQTLAMNVAQEFFALFLGGQHTVESALRRIRLDYLANGNVFGLVYTSYCWADLRIVSP